MSKKQAVVMVILIVVAFAISIAVAARLGAFTTQTHEPKILVGLRAHMSNDSEPYILFEANATWWINTTRIQSQSQKWGFALVGRSGLDVPFNASHIYLPIESTDGYLYCVPQLLDNTEINQSMTIRMNGRVDLIFQADVDWNGKEDSVIRVWLDPDSFFQGSTSDYPLLYVSVWIGDSP